MSVSGKYVFAYGVCRCIDLNTTYYRCISCSFQNNLTNVIIYPKPFCFGRLGYSLLCSSYHCCCYNYFNAWHCLLQCSFIQPRIFFAAPTCQCWEHSEIRALFASFDLENSEIFHGWNYPQSFASYAVQCISKLRMESDTYGGKSLPSEFENKRLKNSKSNIQC